MAVLGRLWADDGQGAAWQLGSGAQRAMDAAVAVGYVLGAELRACGVDLSFTPVLDLNWGPSGVIGDRAFHADARVVTLLATGVMHGLQQAGMAHCAKHFPGDGFVAADSHVAVPRDARPLKAILREQLGFDGAIISDDLSMAGARQIEGVTVGPADAVLAALDAGCDLALLCNQSLGQGAVIDDAIEALARAQLQGRWQPGAASGQRRMALLPAGAAPDWGTLMRAPAYIHALERLP